MSSANISSFLQSFAAASPHVFFVYDPAAGQVQHATAAAQTVLGVEPDHATAALPALLARLHPDDRPLLASFWAGWQAGGPALPTPLEFRLNRPAGPPQWLRLTPHCLAVAGSAPCFGGMLEDITVAKEYIINADKFNAKKNATLEILSHDLAGFFALLQQLSDYVAREMQPNADANLARVLASMQRTSQEGVNLIRDFVDNEFMESAEVDMKSERCDLVGMAKTLLDQYREDQHLLKKTFSLEVSQPTIFAVVDFNKMQQVLNNLLSNAIKFTPDGGNIGVQLTCHSGHITMAVCDTGIGIPPEHLPVLFDRFTKARRPGLRGEKTTGLGMSIIRTLVELHQGTIRVESVVGEGTRFFIELPLAPGE